MFTNVSYYYVYQCINYVFHKFYCRAKLKINAAIIDTGLLKCFFITFEGDTILKTLKFMNLKNKRHT